MTIGNGKIGVPDSNQDQDQGINFSSKTQTWAHKLLKSNVGVVNS